MPASLNTPGQTPAIAQRKRSIERRPRVIASAVMIAFLVLLVGLVLHPGHVSALVSRSGSSERHLQDPATPTLQPGSGAVTGQAWIDADADGTRDAGELPLGGMAISARSSDGGATVTVTSAADGKYRIAGLVPGFHRISAAPPPTYELTTQNVYDALVTAGAVFVLDFGARVPPTPTPSPTPPPLLDIEDAEPLMCGGVYIGNTETGRNNVNSYGCRPWWDESGREKVYRLELTSRQPITVTLLNASADLDLFLLRYALPGSCLAAGDSYLTHAAEVGLYFLSIDGYRGASGSYTFRVDCPTEVQATSTPTLTPSPTPTHTPTGTPAPTSTSTPTLRPNRAYVPLMLLPSSGPTPLPVTFVLQDGLNGYAGTTDSTLNSWEPANPFGGEKVLHIFHARSEQITSQMEAVLRFDLSLLPRNATVEKALLRLYVPATPLYDIRAQVAGLLTPWEEQTTTWEQASPGQPWASPGAAGIGTDRTAWVSESQRIVDGSRWYEFDLTELVQRWSAVPALNYGMIVSALPGESNANVEARFVSRDGTGLWRPQLVLSYTLATAATGQ